MGDEDKKMFTMKVNDESDPKELDRIGKALEEHHAVHVILPPKIEEGSAASLNPKEFDQVHLTGDLLERAKRDGIPYPTDWFMIMLKGQKKLSRLWVVWVVVMMGFRGINQEFFDSLIEDRNNLFGHVLICPILCGFDMCIYNIICNNICYNFVWMVQLFVSSKTATV